ncbi:MAG TPA: lipoprotein-releasing ABC transporter ATP-binding protein LolD [Gammaproteobacteria bacterium]|nr:lipoprotein-releasing ABC transporter ATP-binding protein LolD [Gammaproteobacteria bacterium]
MSDAAVLRCAGLSRYFIQGGVRIDVLRDVNLSIAAAEQVAIVGSSGSGKSTLLHLLGGLDRASAGEVWIGGQPVSRLGDSALGTMRNRQLGFIYQFHHLLMEFPARENVAMPLLIRREKPARALDAADEILSKVGLRERLTHKPSQLSGGERQRAAVARALVTKPRCVLADEPTGNLDHKTAEAVYQQMCSLNREHGTSLLVVTHNLQLAQRMDRILTLKDGRLVDL